jgi:hypothetical protein
MSVAPGWYPDPSNPTMEHWWDGNAYTHSRPRQSSTVPAPYLAAPRPAGVSAKSRTVASILGFFLGAFGVHRFYLGNIGMGVALLFVGPFTGYIWNLIDWIVVLAGSAHDGEGRPVVVWS